MHTVISGLFASLMVWNVTWLAHHSANADPFSIQPAQPRRGMNRIVKGTIVASIYAPRLACRHLARFTDLGYWRARPAPAEYSEYPEFPPEGWTPQDLTHIRYMDDIPDFESEWAARQCEALLAHFDSLNQRVASWWTDPDFFFFPWDERRKDVEAKQIRRELVAA